MDNIYNGPNYESAGIINTKVEKKNTRDGAGAFKKYGLIAIVYAFIATFCLYKNVSSITFPIFMVVTLLALKLARAKDGLSLFADVNGKKALGIFYGVSLMLLSIHRCLTTTPVLLILEGIAIILLFLSFISYLYIDTTGFDIFAWFVAIFNVAIKPIEYFGTPCSDLMAFSKNMDESSQGEKRRTLFAVVIGIIVAIPLLMFVIGMLFTADFVFADYVLKIVENFDIFEDLDDFVGVLVTFTFFLVGSYVLPCMLKEKKIKINANVEGAANPVIAITFTSLVGIVYLFFCGIQIMYLFTRSMTLPEGVTYTEYAHEGFWQLVTVCLMNLVMVSICQRAFKESKILRGILTVIGLCTYIMIASCAMRMLLYISAYYLTFLRVFVLWFLAVLCLWLAFLIIGMYVKNFSVFKAGMIAITVAFIGFVYANPEYQIAKYDIQHTSGQTEEWEKVDDYVYNFLSLDAAPAMASDEGMLSTFADNANGRFREEDYTGVRKFNFSYYKAQKLFKQVD